MKCDSCNSPEAVAITRTACDKFVKTCIDFAFFTRDAMYRTLLKSKIHRVKTTHCELHYEGSCAIDEDLMDAANIMENEQIHIWNVDNGERFVTYAIKGERGSGMISVNGSAARRACTGDLLIIASFAQVEEKDVAGHQPQLVFVNEKNQQVELRHKVPTQML